MRAPLTNHQIAVVAAMRTVAKGSEFVPARKAVAFQMGCTQQAVSLIYVKLERLGWIERVAPRVYKFAPLTPVEPEPEMADALEVVNA